MYRTDEGPSWSVISNSDMSLNFAIYVACAYGLIDSNSYSGKVPLWPYKIFALNKDLAILQKEWNVWWDLLIKTRTSNLASGTSSPISSLFHPPNFDELEIEEISELCRKAWPSFTEWWGMPAGGQTAMSFWESFNNIIQYVKKYEEHIGRRVKPFKLYIDLVYTGLDNRIEMSSEYVIMPLIPRPLADEEWWINKLREIG